MAGANCLKLRAHPKTQKPGCPSPPCPGITGHQGHHGGGEAVWAGMIPEIQRAQAGTRQGLFIMRDSSSTGDPNAAASWELGLDLGWETLNGPFSPPFAPGQHLRGSGATSTTPHPQAAPQPRGAAPPTPWRTRPVGTPSPPYHADPSGVIGAAHPLQRSHADGGATEGLPSARAGEQGQLSTRGVWSAQRKVRPLPGVPSPR